MDQPEPTLETLLAEERAKNAALIEYARQCDVIMSFSQEFAAQESNAALFASAARFLRRIFPGVTRASLALIDPGGESATVYALKGGTSAIPVGHQLELAGTNIERACTTKNFALAVGSKEKPSEFTDVRMLHGAGVYATLSSPMMSNDVVIGTVNIGAPTEAELGEQAGKVQLAFASILSTYLRLTGLVEELEASLESARVSKASLESELRERIEAEDRLRAHEEVIHEQHQQMLAMSTPLIPINDRVVVLPLIGVLSEERMRRLLEVVLSDMHSLRADTVIIDLTGVAEVDRRVGESLVRITSALRLLGCETLLTGIKAEHAATLVGLGVDLSDARIHATLSAAVSSALAG